MSIDDFQSKAEILEKHLDIRDRKWRTKIYKDCFVGSEAVRAIIHSKIAASTYGAIIFGNNLITSDLIVHVENEHIFKNESLYYQYTEKYKKLKIKGNKKKKGKMLSTEPKPKKKVSFAMNPGGFTYKSSAGNASNVTVDDDSKHWSTFGSLSKSEFSYMSDRSSFAASLNTLSDANIWIVDDNKANENKIDFTKEENKNITGFTFGASGSSSSSSSSASASTKRSITSPSMSNSRFSKSTSGGHSITFSSTVSLFSDSIEKKQNSLLFFDLWGVPLHVRETSAESNAGAASSSLISSTSASAFHTPSQSSLGSGIRRRPSTFIGTGPIEEEDEEEWSEFSVKSGVDDLSYTNDDDVDETEEPELMSMSGTATATSTTNTNDDNMSTTKIQPRKKSSGGFKYRKRKSMLTANFVFGNKK